MIDFHTHILPNMDDGSRSVEESVAMLQTYSPRVTDVFLTPHFYPWRDNPSLFFKRRQHAMQRLQQGVEGSQHPVLHLGAEVAYFEGIHNCSEIEQFVIEGTRLLLVEMPMDKWNSNMIEKLIQLSQDQKIRPVLAHIDRYGFAKGENSSLLEEYLKQGGLVQVNAGAVLSFLSRKKVISMVRQGAIHFMGSDTHNMGARRPNYDRALDYLQKKGAEDVVSCISSAEKLFCCVKN